ncbi:MAG: transposase [Deltaproteobacteria bacterium]|nr:transposase [Deltaproteobacteria bacterium]
MRSLAATGLGQPPPRPQIDEAGVAPRPRCGMGVTKSHSRPHVFDDNRFSEAHFKTLKYRPDFPGHFDALAAAVAYHRGFFRWYNHEHLHEALGLLTPADVHFGRPPVVLAARQRVLDALPTRHISNASSAEHRPPACSPRRPGLTSQRRRRCWPRERRL